MIDIGSYFASLRASWVSRFVSGEILQTWIKMGGGQTKMLSHFAEIRKQLIQGNKFIMFKNKSLMIDNWINSDLIYINDILNENREISQNVILDKLKYKNNWISEFICLKKRYLMNGIIHYRLKTLLNVLSIFKKISLQ